MASRRTLKASASVARANASAARAPSEREQRIERIHATVDSIPRGKVASYGQVASEAGLPGRARLVGRALRGLGARSPIAWQRVLGAGGMIKLERSSRREQLRRLRLEGVLVDARGRVDLECFGLRG